MNAAQDSIIAQHNKPLHFLSGSWSATPNASKDDDAIAVGTPDALGFTAWLDLSPWVIPGDTIKEITWRYFNGSTPTAGTIRFFVRRTNVVTMAVSTVFDSGAGTYNTNTGGADAIRNQLTAINHVVLSGYFYTLSVVVDGTGADDGAGLAGATVQLGV